MKVLKTSNCLTLSLLFAICLFFGAACSSGNDEPECVSDWESEVHGEFNALYSATLEFTNSPTLGSCQAYISAYQDYLDALSPLGNCAELSERDKENWQQTVENAEETLAMIDCSGL